MPDTLSTQSVPPLVSCLCVTENRAAFMPWLLWNFDKQRWPHRELVIVDSSPEPYVAEEWDNVRVIAAAVGTNVPTKRNLALQQARGEIITWFDDDDWQHPNKVTWLVEALQAGAVYAGTTQSWFVNLAAARVTPYRAAGKQIIFNSAGFRRAAVAPLRFPEDVHRASDSRWMQQLQRRHPHESAPLPHRAIFFWLAHTVNLSNPASKRRGTEPLATLRQVVADAWDDTDLQLAALRARIADAAAQPLEPLQSNMTAPLPPVQQLPARATIQTEDRCPGRKRVGILTVNDPRRGLWRDAECLIWALTDETLRPLKTPGCISLFPLARVQSAEHNFAACRAATLDVACPTAVAVGTSLVDWLQTLDRLIVCETLLPRLFQRAHALGIQVIYIPNLDWALTNGSVEEWLTAVQRSHCRLWAKSEQIQQVLQRRSIPSDLVPWSIPDPVRRDRAAQTASPVHFLINAGMGGWRNRRGVDLALTAYAHVRSVCPDVLCTVKSIRPVREYVPAHLLRTEGLEVVEGMLSRAEITRFYDRADVVLYPSRWEGFGLSLLEALHAGLPVLATDGWPMNELIEEGHNGLLVAARNVGAMRLAVHWECDADKLAQAMIQLATDRTLLRRLTCPEPAALVARQFAFVTRVRELVLGEAAPRVLLFRPRTERSWRRSEEYWADALRQHGYQVDVGYFDTSVEKLSRCLRSPHEFVLVSKAPVDFVKRLKAQTAQPIVMWHHDLCTLRRHWLESVAPALDLLCVPEGDVEQRCRLPGTPTVTLLPGAKVDGDRGPGRRPRRLPAPDSASNSGVIFVGNRGTGRHRLHLLQQIAKQTDLHVYGEGWQARGFTLHPPVWSDEAVALQRSATVVLSISHDATIPHYTSNRLFNSCGAGACVVAEAYPGVADQYPAGAVATFRTTQECIALIEQLHRTPMLRHQMRLAAEEHTWRNHTWMDRIYHLLQAVRQLPQGNAGQVTVPATVHAIKKMSQATIAAHEKPLAASVRFWNQRCRQLGHRAPGYYRLSEAAYRDSTEAWWARITACWPVAALPAQSRLLDFGCGEGRFARRLAELEFQVTGADISPEMLQLAAHSAHPRLTFHQLPLDGSVDFADNTFDALWVATVLQHIPDAIFPVVVHELCRVVRPGGWLLLCENTHAFKRRTSASGHVVFRTPQEYLDRFPGSRIADSFVANGEEHTIFVGQLQKA